MRLADQEGNATRRTAYALNESFECHCEPAKATQGARVSIKFEFVLDEEDLQERPVLQREIVATIGRNHNFSSSKSSI